MSATRYHRNQLIMLCALSLSACASRAYGEPSKVEMMALREHIDKGNYAMARQSFQQAIDEYEQCLNIDPMNQVAKDNIVLAHNNWGIANFRARKYDEAKMEWERALKLNPYDRNAKNNLAVLKATLAKMGIQPGEGSGAADDAAKKSPASGVTATAAGGSKEMKEPPPAAVILTPIPKAQPPQDDTTAVIINSSSTSGSTSNTAPAVHQTAPEAPISTYSTPSGDPPAPTPAATNTTPAASGNYVTIEERLNAIEQKLYGHKQDKMPVLKRLEKIETDTSGQPHKGTIEERIEALRQNYGV